MKKEVADLINYSKNINEFSADRVITKFTKLHPHVSIDVEEFRQFLLDFRTDCCNPIKSLENRIINTKRYKEVLGGLMDSYCSDHIKFTGIDFIDNLVKEYRKDTSNAELNSAIITILRIPNWPMLSDDELAQLNKSKKPDDLGVLDIETCPYNLKKILKERTEKGIIEKLEVPYDLMEAIDLFFDNVSDYVENNFVDQPDNIIPGNDRKMLFSKNDIKLAILKIRGMINGTVKVPKELEEIITYYRKLKNSDLCSIYRKNKDGFHEDSFMETESGCQMNSYRSLLTKLNESASVARVSNTIGNYFCGSSKYVNAKMKKIIPFLFEKSGLSIPMDVVDFSYGKGDAYKTRIVYILWTVIQNILGPLAKRWGKLQEKLGYNLIGTTHQHELLNQVGTKCKDGIGIDYTQYSDYLFKGVFYEILQLIGFSKSEAKDICDLVSLPILFDGIEYPVELASNMGVKMDFVLITEANLYMYVVSSLITNSFSDNIVVVGDDRWETLNEREFSEREVYTKLQVACCFNCKLNTEKTSWSKRDGIFGGCHVWYNKFGLPSTGIAPSQLLKDFYQINDYNALINKVKDSGQDGIYTEEIIIGLLRDKTSMELLKRGNRKFGYKDEDLEKYLNNALNIPYQFGGLGYHLEELDPRYYAKPIFQNLINILKNNTTSSFDRFVKIFHLENNFITISLNNRKGARNIKEISELMRDLSKLNQPGLVTNEFLQSIRKRMQKYFDLQRKLENQGRSTSTKNRQRLRFDSDKLFRQEKEIKHITYFDYQDSFFTQQLLLSFHRKRDKESMIKIFSMISFLSKIEGSIELYDGAAESFWGLKTNEFPNKYVRLESTQDNRYEKKLVTRKELVESKNYSDYCLLINILNEENSFKEMKEAMDKLKVNIRDKMTKEFIMKFIEQNKWSNRRNKKKRTKEDRRKDYKERHKK